MKIDKVKITFAVLISIALVLTAYTLSAFYVASTVIEWKGLLFWPNTLGGTFYPWPNVPQGISGQMLTQLAPEDALYYNYIIGSGVLVALPLALWIIVLWRALRMRSINRPQSLR